MKIIARQGNYVVSSSFGRSVEESTENAGTNGKIINFQIDQVKPVYNSFYWKIEPVSGSYDDFWEDYFSNVIGGEPADEFAASGFTSGEILLKINPDKLIEFDEKFKINFYLSNLDPEYGVAPVASATFTIIDDDPLRLVGSKDPETLIGRSADDSLSGRGGDDTLIGNKGDDFLSGDRGADRMEGGAGDDTYVVDDTGDKVIEKADLGTDLVKTARDYVLGAHVENVTLIGSKAVDATGNNGANVLNGNAGKNVLDGGDGNNVLNGGLGLDTLKGGSDRDSFVFDTKPSATNVDHIKNFSAAHDTIELENAVFKRLSAGPLKSDAFEDVTDSGALDANDRILYDRDTGRLFYDADGSGASAKVLLAVLDNHSALTFRDFEIV